jgi:hypothetical protein
VATRRTSVLLVGLAALLAALAVSGSAYDRVWLLEIFRSARAAGAAFTYRLPLTPLLCLPAALVLMLGCLHLCRVPLRFEIADLLDIAHSPATSFGFLPVVPALGARRSAARASFAGA